MKVELIHSKIPVEKLEWMLVNAVSDGKTVGNCLITNWQTSAPMLAYLHVQPPYRRKGVATAIIKACLKTGKFNDKEAITLVVNKKNKSANRLYKKLGFKTIIEDKEQKWMSYIL